MFLAQLPLAEIQFGPFSLEGDHPIPVFIAQLVGFLLMVLLLWKVNVPVFSWPYLSAEWKEREGRIEEIHNQVDSAMSDTRRLHDDYAERLKNIEAEARVRIDAAVREADAAHNDIISDAQEAATLLKRRAEEELARERTRQRILLRRQIVQISLDAAEGSIRDNDSDAMQRRLISDFIARAGGNAPAVVAAPAASGVSGAASPATATAAPKAVEEADNGRS